MDIQITPRHLSGTVTPPPSKSMAHRLLIARALAGENLDDPAHRADSQDIRATRDCLKSLREGEGERVLVILNPSEKTVTFPWTEGLGKRIYGQGGAASVENGTVTVPAKSASFYRV